VILSQLVVQKNQYNLNRILFVTYLCNTSITVWSIKYLHSSKFFIYIAWVKQIFISSNVFSICRGEIEIVIYK